jgi:hypothetical protein
LLAKPVRFLATAKWNSVEYVYQFR